jgi:hypothetical protein
MLVSLGYEYSGTVNVTRVVLADSELVLSPAGTARVCPETALEITCSTDRTFLNWNVTILPSARESGQAVTINRLVSSSNQGSTLLIIYNNNIVFNISIVSTVDPFTSVLSVINVTDDLNGTIVQCEDFGISVAESRTSLMTFVHIIQTDIGRYI